MAALIPTIDVPSWFEPRATDLIKQLGSDHPDVQLFRIVLERQKVDQACLDGLTELIAEASELEASQLAIDLSMDCLNVGGLAAMVIDTFGRPATTYPYRIGYEYAGVAWQFPDLCSDLDEAINLTLRLLSGPGTSKLKFWIEGPECRRYEAAEIRTIASTRTEKG